MVVRKTSARGAFRLTLACVGLTTVAVFCALALAGAGSAWAASSEPTTYSATETVPVPPASNFASSGGGDGWAVALSSTQVFNVYHHSSTLRVVCHNQSDASTCWGPDTIQDGSGNNFATEGHPGMYFDQNTGKLYVYATRTSDSTGGVVCVDTTQPSSNPNPFCGFTALTAAGENPMAALSTPMLYGNRWYAFNFTNSSSVGAENRMLCFDVSSDAPCAGQPYPVNLGAGSVSVGSFPSPSTALIGSQLIVPIYVGGVAELACLDASTNGACGGSWPATISESPGGFGAPYPLLDANGNLTGLCLPTGTDECYTLSGSSTATPSGMAGVISGSDGWNGPAFVLGPRVYVPNGNANAVQCYDSSTSASCANFPKTFSNLGYLYTVNADPQRPSCIWVNADNGSAQIQNFDAYTGGQCGQGPVRALASQFVGQGSNCTPGSYNYLQIVSPSPSQYSGGKVEFQDGDGNPIPGAPPRSIDASGRVDLTGLNLNTPTGLPQFLITLNGQNDSQSALKLTLSWSAAYDTSCIDDDATAANPAITATGSSVNPTEGASFTGTVATFTDPDLGAKPGEYSASVNWGDGITSTGSISGSASQFKVNGTHTYAEEGSFRVTVTITDSDNAVNSASTSSTATVHDAALNATAVLPSRSARTASGTVATFTDGDPKGTLSDYSATIDWGDGAKTTGNISAQNGQFAVSGSHTYPKSGTHTVTVTIKDIGGSSATVTIAAQVKAAKVKRGSARLTAACTRGGIDAEVLGSQIASVRFRLDGATVAGRTISRGRHYASRMSVSPGSHTLAVTVTFRASSKTAPRTFDRTVSGCTLPTFTG